MLQLQHRWSNCAASLRSLEATDDALSEADLRSSDLLADIHVHTSTASLQSPIHLAQHSRLYTSKSATVKS
eukprot:238893-Pyramimonas_sp.AAC.1